MTPDPDALRIRIATHQDKDWIVKAFMKSVPQFYDDAEESYCDLWWASHFDKRNDSGFFSLSKEVLVFERGCSPVGFTVLTYKRGGSLKISPLIFDGKRKDLVDVFSLIEGHARARQIRKLYFDIPSAKWPLFSLLGLIHVRIEAHLEHQYSKQYDSIVGAVILNSDGHPIVHSPVPASPISVGGQGPIYWTSLQDQHRPFLIKFVQESLTAFYDGLDATFIASIYRGMLHRDSMFQEKGKYAYVLLTEDGDNIVSLCVLTPKRGGALRLGPLHFRAGTMDQNSAEEALLSLMELIKGLPLAIHKVYTMIPLTDGLIHTVLPRIGFKTEGVLREPYKAGVDFVVYGLIYKQESAECNLNA